MVVFGVKITILKMVLGYTSVLIQGVKQVRESASGNQIIQSFLAQVKRREFKSLHFPRVLMQDCDGHSWR